MKTAYSYIRFSSKKQEQNDSVRRQIRLRDEWLLAHPEVTLDTLVSLQDLGVSAFRGANLDPELGDLGKFIALLQQPKSPIEKGSYLLLERLDRFSRQKVSLAYTALLQLVKGGLTVVVLDPSPHEINSENVDQLPIVLPIVTNLCLAHEQSREKSKRVGYAWRSRREDARTKGKLYTKRTPAWIYYDEQTKTLKVDELKAEAIRAVFNRTCEGIGQVTLVREMNEKYPPITKPSKSGKPAQWNTSYICKILNDRSVLGEFQPHYMEDGKRRIPDGTPIKEYFPRVIPDDIFYKAQYQKSLRKKERTEKQSGFVNLFTGLVVNLHDNSLMQIQTSRTKRRNGKIYVQRRLWSDSARKGMKGRSPWSIEYHTFESAVLSSLTELNPDNFRQKSVASDERASLYQQIEGCALKISELEKVIGDLGSKHSAATAMRKIDELYVQKEGYEDRLKAISGIRDTSSEEAIEGLESIAVAMEDEGSPHYRNVRHKLKSIIPTIVECVKVRVFKKTNNTTMALAFVFLRDGSVRTVAVRNCPAWRDNERMVFYDKRKVPMFLISPSGVVFWPTMHKLSMDKALLMTHEEVIELKRTRSEPHWVLIGDKMELFSESKVAFGPKPIPASRFLEFYWFDYYDDFTSSSCVPEEATTKQN